MSRSPLNQGQFPFTNPGVPYAPAQPAPASAAYPFAYGAPGPAGGYPPGTYMSGSEQGGGQYGGQYGGGQGGAPVRQQGPGTPMQYPQGNTFQDQFLAERTPGEMARLDALSRQAGEQLGPQTILRPFIAPKKITGIVLNTFDDQGDFLPGPNDQNAEFVLDYYFPFATYIRKITATLIDPILNAKFNDTILAANSPFAGDVSALDFIEAKLERANNENIFTDFAPLSEWTGTGQLSYVWDLIPYISRAETIRIVCRIPKAVPYSAPGDPVLPARHYFDYISALNITLHTMRFPAP